MNTLIFEYSRPIPLWLGRKSPDQPYKVARRAEKRERERERASGDRAKKKKKRYTTFKQVS